MVGREPDLNPPIDWEKELSILLRQDDSDDDDLQPLTKVARMSKPVLQIPVPSTVDEDPSYLGRLATPLIQVFSVRVFTRTTDEAKPCEIYGSIRAYEGSDSVFLLYDRDPQNSESVSQGGTLSLIGPNAGAIIPCNPTTTLDLRLSDRVRGVELVNRRLNLDPVGDESYDRIIKEVIEGAHGVAHVYYTVFRFATYGTVCVTVTKNDNVPDIYGSVIAGYGNGSIYCNADEEITCLETRLLDTPSHRPLHLVIGEPTPITLTRNAVVVPVYSTLTIQVNLWDSNGETVNGCLQFPAHVLRVDPLSVRTQNACVEVLVNWHNAYKRLYNFNRQAYPRTLESNKDVSLQKMAEVSDSQHISTSIVGDRDVPYGHTKIEVFSVYVGGITKNLSALCGTIIIRDGSYRFSIFKRDENHLQLLEDDGLACIDFNYRAIRNTDFGIILNLKDPVGKLEVSRGDLGWHVGSLGPNMFWYNKRLCTVVRGNDGYAAVHYEIFYSAVEAFVEVTLFGGDGVDMTFHLHGSLNGYYGTHDYSTSYQKKYFVSRLFERPRNKPLELKSGSKIPLSKSIIVVPVNSFLKIDANLGGSCLNNIDVGILGCANFKIDMSKTISQQIPGNGYWVDVSVRYKV